MTVKDILTKWLQDNGYDGLACVHSECGCEVEDIIPCASTCELCEPAYRGPDLEYGGDWAMYTSKEAADAARRKR